MTSENRLTELELAALVSSKVCHDLVNPAGALENGLELLSEESDEETRGFALELVRKSARSVSSKLKFCRLAFGAAGSVGAEIDVKDAEDVAKDYIEADKFELVWSAPQILLPKNVVKLLLNLVLIAIGSAPRGGKISVVVSGDASSPSLEVKSEAERHIMPKDAAAYFEGSGEKPADAHQVQPYYAWILAEDSGMTVKIEEADAGIAITATKA